MALHTVVNIMQSMHFLIHFPPKSLIAAVGTVMQNSLRMACLPDKILLSVNMEIFR